MGWLMRVGSTSPMSIGPFSAEVFPDAPEGLEEELWR